MAYNLSRLYLATRDRIANAVTAGEFGDEWVMPAWKSLTAAERGMFKGRRDFEFAVSQKMRCAA